MILFSINFRSVCVGKDKDKQNTGHGATQGCCDEEKKVQKQKEDIKESLLKNEKETKDLEIKDATVPRGQITAESSHIKSGHYRWSNYWFIDGYGSLYERDYFYDEGYIEESLECCNCCEIL